MSDHVFAILLYILDRERCENVRNECHTFHRYYSDEKNKKLSNKTFEKAGTFIEESLLVFLVYPS